MTLEMVKEISDSLVDCVVVISLARAFRGIFGK